jgi:hypothetical protein
MSGSKRRLGTSSDARFGIAEDADKIEMAYMAARLRKNKSVSERVNPAQKDYFTRGIKRNPLLIIYFVGLTDLTKDKTSENEAVRDACKNTLYIGFGIGIPTLENQATKFARYVLNKVAIEKLFEGEGDGWDDEEEFSD